MATAVHAAQRVDEGRLRSAGEPWNRGEREGKGRKSSSVGRSAAARESGQGIGSRASCRAVT